MKAYYKKQKIEVKTVPNKLHSSILSPRLNQAPQNLQNRLAAAVSSYFPSKQKLVRTVETKTIDVTQHKAETDLKINHLIQIQENEQKEFEEASSSLRESFAETPRLRMGIFKIRMWNSEKTLTQGERSPELQLQEAVDRKAEREHLKTQLATTRAAKLEQHLDVIGAMRKALRELQTKNDTEAVARLKSYILAKHQEFCQEQEADYNHYMFTTCQKTLKIVNDLHQLFQQLESDIMDLDLADLAFNQLSLSSICRKTSLDLSSLPSYALPSLMQYQALLKQESEQSREILNQIYVEQQRIDSPLDDSTMLINYEKNVVKFFTRVQNCQQFEAIYIILQELRQITIFPIMDSKCIAKSNEILKCKISNEYASQENEMRLKYQRLLSDGHQNIDTQNKIENLQQQREHVQNISSLKQLIQLRNEIRLNQLLKKPESTKQVKRQLSKQSTRKPIESVPLETEIVETDEIEAETQNEDQALINQESTIDYSDVKNFIERALELTKMYRSLNIDTKTYKDSLVVDHQKILLKINKQNNIISQCKRLFIEKIAKHDFTLQPTMLNYFDYIMQPSIDYLDQQIEVGHRLHAFGDQQDQIIQQLQRQIRQINQIGASPGILEALLEIEQLIQKQNLDDCLITSVTQLRKGLCVIFYEKTAFEKQKQDLKDMSYQQSIDFYNFLVERANDLQSKMVDSQIDSLLNRLKNEECIQNATQNTTNYNEIIESLRSIDDFKFITNEVFGQFTAWSK